MICLNCIQGCRLLKAEKLKDPVEDTQASTIFADVEDEMEDEENEDDFDERTQLIGTSVVSSYFNRIGCFRYDLPLTDIFTHS